MGPGAMTERIYDIFITHAWRYHDDWVRAGELLDGALGGGWRNFSVPWYDPALDPNTEVGARLINRWLEQQIVPVTAVILLSSVFEIRSARKWVMLELELAWRHKKRIIGLPAFGSERMAPEAAALADVECPWDAKPIIAAMDSVPAI